jgi:hypothetical protein
MSLSADRLDPPVEGACVLSQRDNFLITLVTATRLRLILGAIFLIFVLGVTAFEMGVERALVVTFRDPTIWLTLAGMTLIFPNALTAVVTLFMAADHRRLTFQVGEDEVKVADAAGVALTVPWALVKRADLRFGVLALTLRTRRRRVLMERAFAPADFERVVARARRAVRGDALA